MSASCLPLSVSLDSLMGTLILPGSSSTPWFAFAIALSRSPRVLPTCAADNGREESERVRIASSFVAGH
eukprot:7819318-Pyramimonas_sp.AAC.1